MVKARVPRRLDSRFNPLANGEEEVKEADLVTRLRSADDLEREVACVSAGTLCHLSDPDPVLKALLERFSDPNSQVKLAALQACEALAQGFHQNLIDCGIMTLLEFVLLQFLTAEMTMYESEVERQTDAMVACSALDVLSSLCAYSNTLNLRMSNATFISHILRNISSRPDRKYLLTSALGLLQVLSEDNPAFLQAVPSTFESQLMTIARELSLDQLREQVKICAVLCNYYTLRNDSRPIKENLVPTLHRLLRLDIWQEYRDNILPSLNTPKSVSIWQFASLALEECLQLMSNLTCSEDADEMTEFFPVLITRDSVALILNLAMGLTIDEVGMLSDLFMDSLQCTILSVQAAAIDVLKNIVISGSGFMSTEQALEFRDKFFLLATNWQTRRDEVMAKESVDPLVSGALAIVHLCMQRFSLQLDLTFVQKLMEMTTSTYIDTATNAISVLSSLGRTVHSPALNLEVCKALLAACRSKSLVLVNEALNAFFDIYSEDIHNDVLQTLNVIALMQQGLPVFKAMLAKEEDSDLRETCELTVTNLCDFISYKQNVML